MRVFDYEGDARRAMDVVLGGGNALVHATVVLL